MGKAIISFLSTWVLIFGAYTFLRKSSPLEKWSVVKGLFVAGLTAAVALVTVAVLVALF